MDELFYLLNALKGQDDSFLQDRFKDAAKIGNINITFNEKGGSCDLYDRKDLNTYEVIGIFMSTLAFCNNMARSVIKTGGLVKVHKHGDNVQ